MNDAIKTPKRRLKEARELEIYNDFKILASNPGSMPYEIKRHLAQKYGYRYPENIYPVIRRVEQRIMNAKKAV